MSLKSKIISYPPIWNTIQKILGFPEFKQELYTSVLHPPGRLLDFGCASGHIADAFKDFEYYGVDIDKPSIDAATERFKEYDNMTFIAADIHDRPFEENFFDEVLVAATVHHLSPELFATIFKELAYCTKPGGIVHILDPCVQEKDGWQPRLMRKMDQGKFPRSYEQMVKEIEPLGVFEIGEPTFRTPYGALIQDCDFIHLPLTKRG